MSHNYTVRKSKSNSKSRSRSKSKFSRDVVFCNDFIEKLGKAVIHGTKSINITLLENITKNYHEFPLPFERIPELTDDIIGKTTCFLAIVYQNKDIYSLVKKLIYTTDKQINNFIVNMIGPYFPEGEIVGGDDTQLVTRKKNTNIQVNPTLFFIFSLCCMLFFSFISYNYILLFQTELQNNTAFAFVKDVGSAAMTCNFERIHLSDTESSILKYMKYMKVVDIKLINTFEKTLKLRQCVLDPKDVFKTELFNQNIRSEKREKGKLLNIHTNISPSDMENKQLISKSLALVPSSTTAMLVPTNTMIQYIEDYNTEVYNKIEDKISSDLKTIRDPAALSLYFENLGKMDAKDFKMYFEKEGISDSTQIPTTADLKNILSIFSGSANMFKLFIQGYAGMNIMDIVHTDFKKRMSAIHADILHKKVDLDKYISDLVTDTGTLAKYSIGFYNLLAWFLFLSLKFSAATYYFAKHLKRKQTRTERLT